MTITAPTDITNCICWLDCTDDATVDGDGLTYTWTDKSGSGNNVTCQAGKPIGVHSNPLINSQRMLRVEGGANGSAGGYVTINGIASAGGSAFTLFFVGCWPGDLLTSTNGPAMLAFGRSSSTTPVIVLSTVSSKHRLFARNDASASLNNSSSGNVDNRLALYTLQYTGSAITLHRTFPGESRVQLCSGSFSGTTTLDRFAIGALIRTTVANCADVPSCGLVMYSRSLTGSEVTDVETYLTGIHLPTLANEVTPPTFWASNRHLNLSRITRSGAAYSSTYSTARHSLTGSTGLYYVNPSTGNNANAGTSGSPLKSIGAALAKSDVRGVSLASGLYHKNALWNTYTAPNRSVTVFCDSGTATVVNAEEVTSWTKTGGQTNVYEWSRSTVTADVFDLTNLDANGKATSYTSRASIALVDANPGSYYDNGSKVYVHTFDSRSADSNVVVRIGTIAPQLPFSAAGFFLSVKNVTFYKATAGLGDVAGTNQYLENVKCFGWPENQFSGVNELYRKGCVIDREGGGGDNFDYSQWVRGLEDGCISVNPGTSTTDNCTTAHDTAAAVRINSTYKGGSRNCHDINDTHNWYLACDSSDADTNDKWGFAAGFNDATTATAKTQLNRCTASGNTVDILVGNGATVYLVCMTQSDFDITTHASGTLTDLGCSETVIIPPPHIVCPRCLGTGLI